MAYKPLDDQTRTQCIILMEMVVRMVSEYEKILETGGMALQGVLSALKATEDEDDEDSD